MSRLIDADAIQYTDLNGDHPESKVRVYVAFKENIDRMPTVDAVPVVHGRWETVEDWDGDEHYMCSVCGAEFVLIDGDPNDNDYLYCPHCGADMRKDGGNE